jgi:hypothetical protein
MRSRSGAIRSVRSRHALAKVAQHQSYEGQSSAPSQSSRTVRSTPDTDLMTIVSR